MMTHYIEQFEAIYDGEPWFGDSFITKLAGIDARQVFTRPQEGVHSIAELISHVIFWRTPLIKRLQNDLDYRATMDDESNWYPIEKLKSKGWKALLAEFDQSQKDLIRLLKKAPANFLEEPYRNGEKLDVLVNGVLQHDIYHLGQLGLVSKMLS